MSHLFHTTGIILSRRDHKEVDRWYSIFTKEHGKLEFLARGGHKPLAKLTPHLETNAEVDVLLVHGKQYLTIAGVERRQAFFLNDVSTFLLAQNALSLVDEATKPYERDPILYQLIRDWLYFLSSFTSVSDERAGYLLGSFVLKLMAVNGYRPELQRCLCCHTQIASSDFAWHSLKGGVVCRACTNKAQEQWFAARRVDDEVLKLIRFALDEPFDSQTCPYLSANYLQGFHEILESFLVCHFSIIPAVSLRTACLTV